MEPANHSKRVSIFSWVFTGILASFVVLVILFGLDRLFSENHGFYLYIVEVIVFFVLTGIIFGLLNLGYQRQSYPEGYFSWDIRPKNLFEVIVINMGSALSMFAGVYIGVWLVIGWMALVLS